MTIIKKINSELPSYFESFFGRDSSDHFFYPTTRLNMPAVNILESTEDFVIEIAAPGFEKRDFSINLNNNLLTISSSKENGSNDSNKKYTQKEFYYGAFERTFTLPNSVESDKIEALYSNGILKVSLPKKEEAKVKPPKTIEIK